MNKEDCRDMSGGTSFFSPQSLGEITSLSLGHTTWWGLEDIRSYQYMSLEIIENVEKGPHGDERPSYSAASGEIELRFVFSLNMANLVCLQWIG